MELKIRAVGTYWSNVIELSLIAVLTLLTLTVKGQSEIKRLIINDLITVNSALSYGLLNDDLLVEICRGTEDNLLEFASIDTFGNLIYVDCVFSGRIFKCTSINKGDTFEYVIFHSNGTNLRYNGFFFTDILEVYSGLGWLNGSTFFLRKFRYRRSLRKLSNGLNSAILEYISLNYGININVTSRIGTMKIESILCSI